MRLNDTALPLTPGWAEKVGTAGAEKLLAGVRPEDITLTAEPEEGQSRLRYSIMRITGAV